MLPFVKMQGVGNDFALFDWRDAGPHDEPDWASIAPQLCDRRFGIGADGILVLSRTRHADLWMRMFNPDGSPDVCGNGLRCVARYAFEQSAEPVGSLRILTLAGVRRAQIHRDAGGAFHSVTVTMGQPRFDPPGIPMRVGTSPVVDFPLDLGTGRRLLITALSTGSTHAVTFRESLPCDEEFLSVSPLVENSPLFPQRTSLMWCTPPANGRMEMRIWERGAGETWGCGTGACAAAIAAIVNDIAPAGEPLHVRSQGGELAIRWRPGEPIEMTGPAETVFRGRWPMGADPG